MERLFNLLLAPFVYLYENTDSFMRVIGGFLLVAIPALIIGIMLHSRYNLKVTPKDEKAEAIRQFNEARFYGPAKSESKVIRSLDDVKRLKDGATKAAMTREGK